MRRRLNLALMAVLAVIMSGSARADQALISFSSDYQTGGAEVPTLGWEFTLSQSVVVTHLGLWDYGADGLNHSHLVTIWSTGTVKTRLVEGTVPDGGAPGSEWRWVSVTPTTLGPGTYRIGAVYPVTTAHPNPNQHDLIAAYADSVVTGGAVSYVRDAYEQHGLSGQYVLTGGEGLLRPELPLYAGARAGPASDTHRVQRGHTLVQAAAALSR